MREKRMCTCMCNWVILLYSRKLTEHCKPAIMEKIKIIKKNAPDLLKGLGDVTILCSTIAVTLETRNVIREACSLAPDEAGQATGFLSCPTSSPETTVVPTGCD